MKFLKKGSTKEYYNYGVIYFVLCPNIDRVKIGYTRDLKTRLLGFETSLPIDFKLLGTLQGDVNMERKIHKYLGNYRTKGEWFSYSHCKNIINKILLDGNINSI